MSKRVLEGVGWTLFAAAVTFLSVFELFEPTRLIGTLFNFGHVAFFALVAFGLLRLSRRLFSSWFDKHITHYLVSFFGVAVFGLAIEVVQYFGPRDADLGDVLRDVAGGAIALALLLSFDGRARRELGWFGRRTVTLRMFGLVLLLLTLVHPVYCSMATYLRNASFPQIASFESPWEAWFYTTNDGAELEVVETEAVQPDWTGGRVARVAFEGEPYPSVSFFEPVADWRDFSELAFTVYSPNATVVDLYICVHDSEHDFDDDDSYDDRYNSSLTIEPGVNEILIPLDAIERGPVDRLMDMSDVSAVILFTLERQDPVTMYVDDVHLR